MLPSIIVIIDYYWKIKQKINHARQNLNIQMFQFYAAGSQFDEFIPRERQKQEKRKYKVFKNNSSRTDDKFSA